MLLLCIARIFTDLSIYFAFFAFVLSLTGITINVFAVFCTLAVTGIICCTLHKAPLLVRLLPVLLLIFCFRNTETWGDIFLPLPGCIYVIVQTVKNNWMTSYSYVYDNFNKFFGIYCFFAFLAFLAGCSSSIETYSIPFIIIWLFLSVYLMRILRLSEETLLSRRYMIINSITITFVAVAATIMSLPTVLTLIKSSVKVIYSYTIYPLITAFGYVVFGIFWCFTKLLTLLGVSAAQQAEKNNAELIIIGIDDIFDVPDYETLDLTNFFIICGVVTFSIITILFLKKLLRSDNTIPVVIKNITREKISSENTEDKKSFSLFPRNSNRNKVRNYYKKYLLLCRKHDIPVDGSVPSDVIRDTSENFMNPESVNSLQNIWLPARYSENTEITAADVNHAREAYRKIKK